MAMVLVHPMAAFLCSSSSGCSTVVLKIVVLVGFTRRELIARRAMVVEVAAEAVSVEVVEALQGAWCHRPMFVANLAQSLLFAQVTLTLALSLTMALVLVATRLPAWCAVSV
jgi:hypothetical protein